MTLIILFEFASSNLDLFRGKSWLLELRQALNMENISYIYAEMGFDLWQLLVIHYKKTSKSRISVFI